MASHIPASTRTKRFKHPLSRKSVGQRIRSARAQRSSVARKTMRRRPTTARMTRTVANIMQNVNMQNALSTAAKGTRQSTRAKRPRIIYDPSQAPSTRKKRATAADKLANIFGSLKF